MHHSHFIIPYSGFFLNAIPAFSAGRLAGLDAIMLPNAVGPWQHPNILSSEHSSIWVDPTKPTNPTNEN